MDHETKKKLIPNCIYWGKDGQNYNIIKLIKSHFSKELPIKMSVFVSAIQKFRRKKRSSLRRETALILKQILLLNTQLKIGSSKSIHIE